MMSRKLLVGLPAVFLAAALGPALLSSETSWGFLTAAQSDSVFCSSGPSPETVSASRRGLCHHVRRPTQGHRERLDGREPLDLVAHSIPERESLGHGTLGFDHSVGISLSRIRCTALPARALLHARPWAGLRAARERALSVCFGWQISPYTGEALGVLAPACGRGAFCRSRRLIEAREVAGARRVAIESATRSEPRPFPQSRSPHQRYRHPAGQQWPTNLARSFATLQPATASTALPTSRSPRQPRLPRQGPRCSSAARLRSST